MSYMLILVYEVNVEGQGKLRKVMLDVEDDETSNVIKFPHPVNVPLEDFDHVHMESSKNEILNLNVTEFFKLLTRELKNAKESQG